MKRMKWLVFVMILFLSGCNKPAPAPEIDPFDLFATNLETYQHLFEENRGLFLSTWVVDDVHVRWKCIQFLDNVEIQDLREDYEGSYRVLGVDGKKYYLLIESDERVISDFNFRKGE